MTLKWEVPYTGLTSSGSSHTVKVAVISNGVFWTHTTNGEEVAESLVNYLRGVNVSDGSLFANVHLTGYDGDIHPLRELEVDQNGYIWTIGIIGRDAFKVVSPVTKTVVQSLFSQTSRIYNGTQIRFDPVNNLMWAVRENASSPNVSDLVGISTVDYTEQVVIDLMAYGFANIRSISVDSTRGNIWVFYGDNIRIFRCSDGVQLHSFAAPVAGTSTFVQYIPEKDTILLYRDQSTDIYYEYNASTYAEVRNFTSLVVHPVGYNPFNNLMYGSYLDTVVNEYVLAAFDYDDPSQIILVDHLPDGRAILFCRKAFQDCTYVGIDYVGLTIVAYTLGACDPNFGRTSRIIELCSDEDTSGITTEVDNYDSFNRELILDLTLGAFSIYDMAHANDIRIRDYIDIPPFYLQAELTQLYTGVTPIGGPVAVPTTINRDVDPRGERFKYLITSDTDISIAEYRDYSFVDWRSIDGIGLPFNTYLLTGYELSGDMLRQKQKIYLKLYFERTEKTYEVVDGDVVLANQSGCKVQAQWNWADSPAQGKWGIPFQGYRLFKKQPTSPADGDPFDYGEKVVITKNKLRGRGHCLSLLFVPGCHKDTKLLGWGLEVHKNDLP